MIERRIDAPLERVLAAAAAGPIPTNFADPTGPRIERDEITWSSDADLVQEVVRVARVRSDGDGSRVELSAHYHVRMPYFSALYRPLVRLAVRRSLVHMAEVLEARALARAEPPAPRRPVW